MSDNPALDGFRNPHDGGTSHQGQVNAGLWEKQNGLQPSPQQSWETWDAYVTRINHAQ